MINGGLFGCEGLSIDVLLALLYFYGCTLFEGASGCLCPPPYLGSLEGLSTPFRPLAALQVGVEVDERGDYRLFAAA